MVSIVFAVALGVLRRLGAPGSWTGADGRHRVGLLLSAQIGLSGFKDSLAVPYAGLSLAVEFGGAGLLAAGAVLAAAARPSPARRGTDRRSG